MSNALIKEKKKTAECQQKINELEHQLADEIHNRRREKQQHQEAVQEAIREEQEKRVKAEDKLERIIAVFLQSQRQRYGRLSERFVDDGSTPIPLFESPLPSVYADVDETDDITRTDKVSKGKSKRNKKTIDTVGIPTREVIIPVADDQCVCGCGAEKSCIRYEESKRLHMQPAIFECVIEKREVRACTNGCENNIVTAPLPARILPKCRVTESLLAHIVVSKVLDRQPLYHLEKSIDQRFGWHIQRNTMARWMIQLADRCQPLINLMKDELISYDIASIDATGLQVLNEPNRSASTRSQAYCI